MQEGLAILRWRSLPIICFHTVHLLYWVPSRQKSILLVTRQMHLLTTQVFAHTYGTRILLTAWGQRRVAHGCCPSDQVHEPAR